MGVDLNRLVSKALVSIGLAVFMAVVAVATAGGAAAATTVGLWNFNEAAGARTAVDSSGFGQSGAVGSLVTTGVSGAYRFSTGFTLPQERRLVTVASTTRLDPAAGHYAATVRFKTTRASSNVVQKGQSGTAGGYWKFEIHNGLGSCVFRGSGGINEQRGVFSTSRVDNGAWHVVRCDRSSTAVSITVDGVKQKTLTGPTGTISNAWPVSIGGKSSCNGGSVGCDFFAGDIDYVRIEK